MWVDTGRLCLIFQSQDKKGENIYIILTQLHQISSDGGSIMFRRMATIKVLSFTIKTFTMF